MIANVLVLERRRRDIPVFSAGLRKKGYFVETVTSGSQAISRLGEVDPDVVVVNAASLRTTGSRICQALRESTELTPIILINSPDKKVGEHVAANVVLTLPFTIRKLNNRLIPLVSGDGGKMLHVGPIRLDLERRRVRCLGKKARLTPRLTFLLQVLMSHPGEVLERSKLFSEVWETDYTGDTRTLDVHISWLRRAIEPDARHPRFIKTLRGIGYRLDVEN